MTHADADRVRDHWYWRPGWSVGRRFYTWHITFADQPDLIALAQAYQPALEQLACVDPIPPRWLHLTMQGLGFIDEVDRTDIERIVERVQARCAELRHLNLAFGAPLVDPESLQIVVEPADEVRHLRSTIRLAIGDIWGTENVPDAELPFTPHMSLGYTNADAPGAPLRAAIDAVPHLDTKATISSCQLIVLHRDNRMYEWETFATVNLG